MLPRADLVRNLVHVSRYLRCCVFLKSRLRGLEAFQLDIDWMAVGGAGKQHEGHPMVEGVGESLLTSHSPAGQVQKLAFFSNRVLAVFPK